MSSPRYLFFVNSTKKALLHSWSNTRIALHDPGLEALVLLDSSKSKQPKQEGVTYIYCDITNESELQETLAPYLQHIAGIFYAGESNVQLVRKLRNLLPQHMLVASNSSLEIATDKKLMREAFRAHFPEITPSFLEVKDSHPSTIAAVESKLAYPVIIKPANLASSLLIQACHDREELQNALTSAFQTIRQTYEINHREAKPTLIVEEYLEGDFYSVDAYVMKADKVFTCPPVAYVSNKQRGIDDFSLYKRWIPVTLTSNQLKDLDEVTRKAIESVGLTHSTVHVELVLTKRGWKVIELGPRMGRYRHNMYEYGYAFNHCLNDARIHLGLEPVISDKLQNYCAAYSLYPEKEGLFVTIDGIDILEKDPNVTHLNVSLRPGAPCLYAKNGGKLAAEFYVSAPDKHAFETSVSAIEKNVHIKTSPQ